MKRTLLLVLLLSVIAGALVLWQRNRSPKSPPEELPDITFEVFSTKDIQGVIATPGSVTVQRLHPRPSMEKNDLSEYEHGPAIPVPADVTRKLATLFQNHSSFLWNGAKLCIPNYGVLFTFRSQEREVQMALCFDCNMFGIFESGAQLNAEKDFDPIAKELANLAKTLFPDDAEIQKLK